MSGLVSRWKWNGNGNDDADANGCTVYDPLWVAGKIDQCLQFRPNTDTTYAKTGLNANLNPTKVTVDGWWKPPASDPTEAGHNNQKIIWDKAYTSHSEPYNQYTVYVTGWTYKNIALRMAVGGVRKDCASANNQWDWGGDWMHLACVYDGAQGRLYKNCVQIASFSAAGNLSGYNTELYFGRWRNLGGGYYTYGFLDDVRVYNRALSVSELTQNMNATNGGITPQAMAKQRQMAALR